MPRGNSEVGEQISQVIEKFSKNMEENMKYKLQEKSNNKKDKYHKTFSDLPEVNQNIIKLCGAPQGIEQEMVEELKPTQTYYA